MSTPCGIKHDEDKPDLSLCPRPALDAMARALMFGAKKYSRNNYRGGFKRTRLIAAALRHLTSYSFGEDNDPESGLSHLDHAIACLAMLITNIHEGVSEDDR